MGIAEVAWGPVALEGFLGLSLKGSAWIEVKAGGIADTSEHLTGRSRSSFSQLFL